MVVTFSYSEILLPIKSVDLHLCLRGSNKIHSIIQLSFCDVTWTCCVDLPYGDFLYKFVIDKELPLCDIQNSLYDWGFDDTLWSLLYVSEKGVMKGDRIRHVSISHYCLSANKPFQQKYTSTNSVSMLLSCDAVVGVHIFTLAWYTPSGQLYEFTESPFAYNPEDLCGSVSTRFWLDYHPDMKKFPHNSWSVNLFIDGQFLLSDKFSVESLFSDKCIKEKEDSIYA